MMTFFKYLIRLTASGKITLVKPYQMYVAGIFLLFPTKISFYSIKAHKAYNVESGKCTFAFAYAMENKNVWKFPQ